MDRRCPRILQRGQSHTTCKSLELVTLSHQVHCLSIPSHMTTEWKHYRGKFKNACKAIDVTIPQCHFVSNHKVKWIGMSMWQYCIGLKAETVIATKNLPWTTTWSDQYCLWSVNTCMHELHWKQEQFQHLTKQRTLGWKTRYAVRTTQPSHYTSHILTRNSSQQLQGKKSSIVSLSFQTFCALWSHSHQRKLLSFARWITANIA